MTRAVVTGIGCVTPIGEDVTEFWQNLMSGRSGIRRISLFDPSGLDCQIAAEVKEWDPTRHMDAKAARRAARFSQFAIAAARQAVDDSSLPIDDGNRDDIAIVMNTGGGGVDVIADGQTVFLEKGPNRVGPMLVPAMAPNMASCQVAMQLGTRGPTITSVAACAAGIFAFVDAKRLIDLGEADVVITGGTEANIIPVAVAAMANMRALSTRNDEPEKACRPFDLHRDGFVYGEGAAATVVESLEHAQHRGTRVYAELVGGAVTGDAYHVTAPEPTGHGAALDEMPKEIEMSEIPSFKSDAEAAEWFDTHDTAPYMDDLEQVQERIQITRTKKRPPRKAVGLRLRVDHLEAIKQVAERKGIPYQTMIQMWLVEKLRQEAPDLLPP